MSNSSKKCHFCLCENSQIIEVVAVVNSCFQMVNSCSKCEQEKLIRNLGLQEYAKQKSI